MSKHEIMPDQPEIQVEIRPYEHKTRYYETDMMGIIHQTNYTKWLEDARMDLLEQMGLGPAEMEKLSLICPLLSQSISYSSMVHFDDTVLIETKITRYDGHQMDLDYRITDKESGELRARAKSSHCFMNRSGKPISMQRIYPELDTSFFEFK